MFRIIIETKNSVRYSADTNNEGVSDFTDDLNTCENNEFIVLHCNRIDWEYHIRRGEITGVTINRIGEVSQ